MRAAIRNGVFGLTGILALLIFAPAHSQSWRLDRSTFDTSADACSDFYQYVCGGWARSVTIRQDRIEAAWAADQAEERDREALTQLLTGRDGGPKNRELERLRTFFGSCIATQDAKATNAGWAALRPWLDRIDAIDSGARVMATIRDLQAAGFSVFLQYSGEPDRNDRTRFRAEIHQGPLGLPLALYSEQVPGFQERWSGYRAHVSRMFELSGKSATTAQRDAEAVFRMESALAADSLAVSDKYDPRVSEHVMTLTELTQLAPHFEWKPYLDMVGYSVDRPLNVTSTRYLARLDKLLADTPVEDLRAFMRWYVLNTLGTALPEPLAGQSVQLIARGQQRSRFDECQLATTKAMGVELSRQYSQRIVGINTRNQAQAIAERIQEQMSSAALQTSWLSENARRATKEKVEQLRVKVGFPDTWPATGAFPIRADAFLENVIAARTFEQRRAWQRVYLARQRESWEIMVYPNAAPGMAAARLVIPNGYPDALTNSIVLTAGWLRPPLFDGKAPIEVQFGTFGTLAGHEFVHVLENHQYDAHGEARELWSEGDATAHEARLDCVRDQGNQFVIGDAHLDGTLTVDENLADFAGTEHAYAAMARQLGNRLFERDADGFTRAQRFFIAFAQRYCNAERPEYTRERLGRDGHAPNRFRVNASLANMPEFAAAFSCSTNAAMVRTPRCKVW